MFREKIYGKSFKRYIATWIIGFAFILTLLFVVFSLLYTYLSSAGYGKIHIEETLKIAESIFEGAMEEANNNLERLAKDRGVIRRLSGDDRKKSLVTDKLYGILGKNNEVISIHAVSRNGLISESTKTVPQMYNPAKFSDWGVISEAFSTLKSVVYANNFVWENGVNNAFSLVKKVYDGKELVGYLIMDFSVDYIKSLLESLENNASSKIKIAIFSEKDSGIYNNTDFKNRNVRINSLFVERNKSEIDKGYLYSYHKSKKSGIVYIGFMEKSYIKADVKLVSFAILSALIPAVAVTVLIVSILTGRIVKPINLLVKKVSETDETDFCLDYQTGDIEEIRTIETAFNHLLQRVENYHKNDLEKMEQLRVAEVKALQSQINPHFLYNTLDVMKWEAKLNHLDKIAGLATELGSVLKYGMNLNRPIVTVEEELKLIRSYIYIQKERYGDRFQFSEKVSKEIYGYSLPKLLLQPLVENAVVHGMEIISEKGVVEVSGRAEGEHLIFHIKDNGNGFEKEFAEVIREEKDGGRDSIGLYNVEKRMKLYYGEEYGLRLVGEKETDVEVKILKQIKGRFDV